MARRQGAARGAGAGNGAGRRGRAGRREQWAPRRGAGIDTTPHPLLPISAALAATRPAALHDLRAPRYGAVGEGDGAVVRHGFLRPPSLHEPRLRAADDSHFFDVITQGRGTMAAYANRVPAEDRWAIASYIRALQPSQRASAEEPTPQMHAALRRAAPAEARRRPPR
ncbi:MAG: cytochrome c [Rubrivivax sp.]